MPHPKQASEELRAKAQAALEHIRVVLGKQAAVAEFVGGGVSQESVSRHLAGRHMSPEVAKAYVEAEQRLPASGGSPLGTSPSRATLDATADYLVASGRLTRAVVDAATRRVLSRPVVPVAAADLEVALFEEVERLEALGARFDARREHRAPPPVPHLDDSDELEVVDQGSEPGAPERYRVPEQRNRVLELVLKRLPDRWSAAAQSDARQAAAKWDGPAFTEADAVRILDEAEVALKGKRVARPAPPVDSGFGPPRAPAKKRKR